MIDHTLLLHEILHWPNYTTTKMWLFALKETTFRLNKIYIRADGRRNEAKLFGVDVNIIVPSMFHTFGFPFFVLDAQLNSRLITCPTWELRSQLWIYIGNSPVHTGIVSHVPNPRTGHVSPQFHIFFDNLFTTVPFVNKLSKKI